MKLYFLFIIITLKIVGSLLILEKLRYIKYKERRAINFTELKYLLN